MAKLNILAGSLNVTANLFIQDNSVTTGAGLTGLAWNTAGLTCYYVRERSAAVAVALANVAVAGAHTDGGFVEIDAANMPGVYRLDLPDAVCAAGVRHAAVMLLGAANMAPVLAEIDLNSQVVVPALGTGTVTVVSVVAGGKITVRPYSTWTINVSGVGSLVGRTSLWFGVKDDPATQADAASLLQVEETAGLQYINGAAGVGANATLTVTDAVAGNFKVWVAKSQTGLPPRPGRVWQLKMGIAGGDDTIISEGEFNIGQTVTRVTA